MKLRTDDVSVRTLGTETIVLSLRTSQYFMVRGIGTRLLELLAADVEVADLVRSVVAEYEVDEATAARDIGTFVENLHAVELLH
jgi:hypothetical protein